MRGLTTAASIWVTAAIGILTGIGFYFAAGLGTVLTLGTLSAVPLDRGAPADRVLRHLHGALRARRGDVRARAAPAGQRARLLASTTSATGCTADGEQFEYRMVLRTIGRRATRARCPTR